MLTNADDEDRTLLDDLDDLEAQALEAARGIAGLNLAPPPTNEEAAQAALAAEAAIERLIELEVQLEP